MNETYPRQEVAMLLVTLQWYALSQRVRLFSQDKTFAQHAYSVMEIHEGKIGKEAIDAVIDYAQKLQNGR